MERESRNLAYWDMEHERKADRTQQAAAGIPIAAWKRAAYLAVKRFCDVTLSALALAALSPVFLIAAIAIKREDGGPVIHTRYCVGKNNSTFKMYKFRTMVVDADHESKYLTPAQRLQLYQEQKVDNDPRITKTGRILRRTSLDELPQLVSILKGDMSIVGPRPIVAIECQHYEREEIPLLLAVRPGLTGLWQVSGRSGCTYKSGERQKLELYYAQNASAMMDIYILLKTVGVVLKGIGAK